MKFAEELMYRRDKKEFSVDLIKFNYLINNQ